MFKLGQRFTTNFNPDTYSGCVFEIVGINTTAPFPYTVKVISDSKHKNPIGAEHRWKDDGGGDMKIINNKKSMENLKEKFITAFLAEPEKSFRKAGITNGDGVLTAEGQEVFLTWLLKKHGDDFKKEVVDVLLEDEKKKD